MSLSTKIEKGYCGILNISIPICLLHNPMVKTYILPEMSQKHTFITVFINVKASGGGEKNSWL